MPRAAARLKRPAGATHHLVARTLLALAVAMAAWPCVAEPTAGSAPIAADTNPLFLLGPPRSDGPVRVQASFELHDINEIDDVAETFDFTGVLTLTWHDARQAFEPAPGAEEKIFQGDYQFDEVATGWYPQLTLVNSAGSYQKDAVVLRVKPDGTSTLIEAIVATAETELDLRWFPFDAHRLEAVFEVLGFDRDEVELRMAAAGMVPAAGGTARLPQWSVTGSEASIRERSSPYAGARGVASALVVGIDVERESFYVRRLISFPLSVIVLLSFSVFWMDRSSLGDRISVSFIGILTAVTYQLVMTGILPQISYFTLFHGFLIVSFLTMCATVVVNLVVGALDKRGEHERGDRVDYRCRWIFPLAYFGLVLALFGAASLFF